MRIATSALLITLFFNFVLSTAALAQSDLLVYPTHVLLTDKQRTAQVDIINAAQTQASYRISLVRKRMTENGAFVNISTAEPDEKFADDIVRFSPRQVTLVPGAGQTVRVLFKSSPSLSEGEYRSHMVFSQLQSGMTQVPATNAAEEKGLSMVISANVGVSIPIIVRHGKLQAKAAIDPKTVKVAMAPSKPQTVEFMLTRSGTRSVYGDVTVYRGKDKVAAGNGFSVYTPNRQRKIELLVAPKYRIKSGDTIRIEFTEKDEHRPMAETTVVTP